MTSDQYRSIVFFLHRKILERRRTKRDLMSHPTHRTEFNKQPLQHYLSLTLIFIFESKQKTFIFYRNGRQGSFSTFIPYHIDSIKKKKLVPRKELLNPLHPNINMHILHTIIHTFLIILTRRICLKIKSLVYHLLYSQGLNEIEHYSLM